MMKLVISFDEMYLDNGFVTRSDEFLFNRLTEYINIQFPEWDINEAFDVKSIQWDFDNMECHVDMVVI